MKGQGLKIQMDSVPKLKFQTVDKTPENKRIANQIIQEKLSEKDKSSNNMEFFDPAMIWYNIKSANSMPLQMAINQSLTTKNTKYKQLIDRTITLIDTIPINESHNIDNLILKCLIKRLAYETQTYGTHYYIRHTFFDDIEIKNITKKIYKTKKFSINYFIATVNIPKVLIETCYD